MCSGNQRGVFSSPEEVTNATSVARQSYLFIAKQWKRLFLSFPVYSAVCNTPHLHNSSDPAAGEIGQRGARVSDQNVTRTAATCRQQVSQGHRRDNQQPGETGMPIWMTVPAGRYVKATTISWKYLVSPNRPWHKVAWIELNKNKK